MGLIAFDISSNNLVLVCEKSDAEKAAGKNKEIGVIALLPAEFEKMLKGGKWSFHHSQNYWLYTTKIMQWELEAEALESFL